MTEAELEELITNCPILYHMAERGSWESIKQYGLLSTSALLDHYAVLPPIRTDIESRHRPKSVEVTGDGLPRAVVRDQIPMSDAGLKRALPAHISPSDWYELLNAKAFFWLSEERLHKLTNAKAYRDREHDVLEVDTRSLIDAHRIQSGFVRSTAVAPSQCHIRATKPFSPVSQSIRMPIGGHGAVVKSAWSSSPWTIRSTIFATT